MGILGMVQDVSASSGLIGDAQASLGSVFRDELGTVWIGLFAFLGRFCTRSWVPGMGGDIPESS